jgi:phospholipid/cholesterol/gamma-HCH transport system substrate-binding protein
MVGATVLVGMLALGWMILKFAGAPITLLVSPRTTIHFIADRADGLSEGSNVTYKGMNVGQITHLTRLPDDQIRIDGQVLNKPPLPGNLKGVIRSTGLLGGGSAMALTLTNGKPEGQLAANQEIPATFAGLDLLPPEFADLATELRLTARQFRESNVVLHMDEQIQHLGKLIDSTQTFIDDPKVRKDIQDSIANLRTATEKANQIGDNLDKFTKNLDQLTSDTRTTIQKTQGHLDDLSKSIGDRLIQLAASLDQFQQIMQKINDGKGTAGQFVNDPKLYEALVDTTQELNATVKDLKRLVQQWEQEGVSLKMGK